VTAPSSEVRPAIHADPGFLTVDEVARRLGMSRWFVYSHGHELGLVKFGGANRYRSDRVDAYLAERLTTAPEQAIPPEPVATSPSPAPKAPARRGRRRRVPLLEPDGRTAA
jgi:excisionase family DNA binding protein